jgi:3-mercaptopropionate dioxygenase
MPSDRLLTVIDDVGRLVRGTDDEYEITARVAERLSALLAGGFRLPPEVTRASAARHMTYPLHIAPDDSWSMASVVGDVGQRTDVHSRDTWCVGGIFAGVEHEIRYLKPTSSAPGVPLTPAGEAQWTPGRVTVCCTTDDDVYAVVAVRNEPTIGTHVYGGNLGTIRRRSYNPATAGSSLAGTVRRMRPRVRSRRGCGSVPGRQGGPAARAAIRRRERRSPAHRPVYRAGPSETIAAWLGEPPAVSSSRHCPRLRRAPTHRTVRPIDTGSCSPAEECSVRGTRTVSTTAAHTSSDMAASWCVTGASRRWARTCSV